MAYGKLLATCVIVCCAAGTSFAQTSTATGLFSLAVVADEEERQSIYDFTMDDIDGEAVELKDFEGEVLLIVNTASKCGLTPQYTALEALYTQYEEQGFSVLAFPANQFGGQEPETNAEIKEFCTLTNYNVTFPIFSKIVVKGEDQHPLYDYLTHRLPDEEMQGEIGWNFAKFLVGRDGTVLARFDPRTKPDDDKVVGQLQEALKAPRPEPVEGAEDADEIDAGS